MPYTQTTLNQLVTQLSTRLADPNNRFWQVGELQAYVIEALQTWQAHTVALTDRVFTPTAANTRFYNLFQLIPGLQPTITDQALILQIQRHLQEIPDATAWVGTEQFTLAGLTNAIQKRRDKFFLESGKVFNLSEVPGPTPPSGALYMDPSVMDIQRVMWKDTNGNYSLVWKADQFTLTAMSNSWFTTPGLPTDYSTVLQHPLLIQLSPGPANIGLVNLFTTNSGGALNPAGGPTVLGVPDDLCWIVKFGAMADILGQEGPGQDKERAAYCEQRWSDGIKLARITNYIRFAYINGNPTFLDSMNEQDTFNSTWMNQTPGAPRSLAVAENIVATLPVPDGVYSLGFDIMQKFPIPAPTDPIQLGQEVLDVIVDYSQHLAVLKEGGDGFKAAYALYKNFMMLAAVQNDRLRAQAQDFDVLSDKSLRQSKEVLRRDSDLQSAELGS